MLEWHNTGLLRDDAELRKLAKLMPLREEHRKLMMAENRTATEAMEFVINCEEDDPWNR